MSITGKSLFKAALLTAILSFSAVAMVALPFGHVAEAKNSGGNGGGNGGDHGGGNGGDHGGGHGGGNGNGGSNKNDAGANGAGKSKAESDQVSDEPDDADDDPLDGIKASQLGKLNGFFHASSQALQNASPNSAPGSISHTFRGLLNELAAQEEAEDGTTPVEGDPQVGIDDLAEVLAGASNKPMSPGIVDAILDKLSEEYGDDYSAVTDPDTANATPEPTDPAGDPAPEEPSFAEALADRVNQINGFTTPDDDDAEGAEDPSNPT